MGKTQKLVVVQFDIGCFLAKHYEKILIMAISMIVISALVSLYYCRTLKSTHWKWFSLFLTIIAIQEVFLYANKSMFKESQITFYYTYFQFLYKKYFITGYMLLSHLKKKYYFGFFHLC